MREGSAALIDAWWRDLFGIDEELRSDVTVLHPHGRLDQYAGWFVAWRGTGVHLSAPTLGDANDVASLRRTSSIELQRPAFWQAFARQRGLEVIGPGVHRYVDVDPGPADGVHEVTPDELRHLEASPT